MHLASQLLTSSSHGSIPAIVLSKVLQGVLDRLHQLLTGSPHGFIPTWTSPASSGLAPPFYTNLDFLKILQGLLDSLSQTLGGDWSHRVLGCGGTTSYESIAILRSNHFRPFKPSPDNPCADAQAGDGGTRRRKRYVAGHADAVGRRDADRTADIRRSKM